MAAQKILRDGSFARADVGLGEGYVDTTQNAIDTVRAAIAEAPGDAYGVRMRDAVGAACDAASACKRLLWQTADDFVRQRQVMGEIIDDAKAAARNTVPQYGHSDPRAYQEAAKGAERQAEGAIANSVMKKVVAESADRATTMGGRFVQAMSALSAAIDSAYADATSPAGLREGSDSSLERIMKLSSIERGIRAHATPAKETWRLFEGFVSRGEDEKTLDLIEATGSMLAEIRNAKAAGGARYSGGLAPDVGSERDFAFRLSRAFTDWARTQVPKSLKIANDAFQDLTAIFRVLVGADIRLLSAAQFRQRHLSGTAAQADSATPFVLQEDWTMRALPGARTELAGWSPRVMTESGQIIRAAKGGR